MECPTGEFPIIPDPSVAIAVADEPDHHGALRRDGAGSRRAGLGRHHVMRNAPHAATGGVGFDDELVIRHLMERPAVVAERFGDPTQLVVARPGDRRPEVFGIVRHHQLTVFDKQRSEAVAVSQVDSCRVGGGQRSEREFIIQPLVRILIAADHSTPSRVVIAVPFSPIRSANAHISSLTLSRSSMIDVDTINRSAPNETASATVSSDVVGRYPLNEISMSSGCRPSISAASRIWTTRVRPASGVGPKGGKPPPPRPARRAAASLWPPIWIGTRPARNGLGKQCAWWNETN